MNIKRIIDKNGKLIFYVAIIIIFTLFAIKSLNSYYEEDAQKKKEEITENLNNKQTEENQVIGQNNSMVESNSIETTMGSFVYYCNNRQIDNAYKMLTDECKKAMFPTVEDFERIYINNIYNIERTYELVRWSTDGNKATYLVTLYGNILATGGTGNFTQEYCTFVENDNGNYKLNINNYIYGEDRDIKVTSNNIIVQVGHVDIYEEYEEIEIIVTNNSSKTICLTGNKYKNNIYLQNSANITYSPLSSEFNNEDIVLNPNQKRTFKVRFNKTYSSTNKAKYLVLSDIILNYEDYLVCEDKANYWNRTSIKMGY